MALFQDNILWIGGFIFIAIFCIAAMLWRNHAAKTDAVLRKEKDTVDSSVSLKPKKITNKLD